MGFTEGGFGVRVGETDAFGGGGEGGGVVDCEAVVGDQGVGVGGGEVGDGNGGGRGGGSRGGGRFLSGILFLIFIIGC